MVRPKKHGDNDTYRCPEGFSACNEDFFTKEGGEDFVVCIEASLDKTMECPITSFAFDLNPSEE